MTDKLYECIYEKLCVKTKISVISRREAEKFLGIYYHLPNCVSKSVLNEMKNKGWIYSVNRDTLLLKKELGKETGFK